MRTLTLALASALAAAPIGAQVQQNAPHAGYVYPAGAQQGTTLQVEVGGQFLAGARLAELSGEGVRVRVLDYDRPLNAQALGLLRDTAQALQRQLRARGGNDEALRKRLAELVEKIGDSLRRQSNPVLSERVTLEVSITPDAKPGLRRLRLTTPNGTTRPLLFAIGECAEVTEREPVREMKVELPATANGRLIPGEDERGRTPVRNPQAYRAGDVDRIRFNAHKGQHIVAQVSARKLIPYLADAVPGWFQATLTLYDARGRELARRDDDQFRPDPILQYTVPADGDYVLEIRDALYRGREDFVYRVSIGELPYITSIFPLGARAGAQVRTTLTGWNIAQPTLVFEAQRPGIYPLNGRMLFAVDTLPELSENEPNGTVQQAQKVALNTIVNGHVDARADADRFSFQGRAGQKVAAEVLARRLGSPLDAVLELFDPTGKRIAWNDDVEDASAGLLTHQADPALLVTLPVNGTYQLRLSDVQQKSGIEFAYRLRLSAPRPDFELRVSPSAVQVPAGGTIPVTVTAIRHDGFAGDIALALAEAPRGLVLAGGLIAAGSDQARVTLTATNSGGWNARSANTAVATVIEGRAQIDGRTVARSAQAADRMMQAFAYQHLVEAGEFWVTVGNRGATAVAARLASAAALSLTAGSTARVEAALPPAYALFDSLQFRLDAPPAGITIGAVTLQPGGAVLTLHADSTAKPGQRHNLIVEISGQRKPARDAQPQRARRIVIGYLPAISIQVRSRDVSTP